MQKSILQALVFFIIFFFCQPLLAQKEPLSRSIIEDVQDLSINRVDFPVSNNGRNGFGRYPNGTNLTFLFYGGIAVSGKVNSELRVSWTLPQSLGAEWEEGALDLSPNSEKVRVYDINREDGFGSDAYRNWSEAVAQGAQYQDVNGDGLYDPNVDRPEVIGDRTLWFVMNDSTTGNRWFSTKSMGIEAHVTAWAYDDDDFLGDVVFMRYRLLNKSQNQIDSVYFSKYADTDIGDFEDDLVGCSPVRNLVFSYNDGNDAGYGSDPPAVGIVLLQGPVVDSPGNTASIFRQAGQPLVLQNDKQVLQMTSFTPFLLNLFPSPFSFPVTAEQARDYQIGGITSDGMPLDPSQVGIGGSNQDPKFVFNGWPLTPGSNNWLDDNSNDRAMLLNSGPFTFAPGDTQDVVVAYVLGRGSFALESLSFMRNNATETTNFFPAGERLDIIANRFPVSIDSTVQLKPDLNRLASVDSIATANWQLTSRPNGSSAKLGSGPGKSRLLTPDVPGQYEVELMIITSGGRPYNASLKIEAFDNRPPVAVLNLSTRNAVFGDIITLDGQLSSDPDGDALDFQWSLPPWHEVADPTAALTETQPLLAFESPVNLKLSDTFFTVEAKDTIQIEPFMENITELAYSGASANIVDLQQAGNRVFALSEEEFPRLLRFTTSGVWLENQVDTLAGNRFLIDGNRMVVYGNENPLQLFSLDGNGNLTTAATLSDVILQSSDFLYAPYFSGQYLFVPAGPTMLKVYDISDIQNALQVNSYAVFPSTSAAFTANAVAFSTNRGIIVHDISDPLAILPVDTLAIGPLPNTRGFLVADEDRLYFLENETGGDEIQIIDLSDPSNATVASNISVEAFFPQRSDDPVVHMQPVGRQLGIGTLFGFRLFDVEDISQPQQIVSRFSGHPVQASEFRRNVFLSLQGDISSGAGVYILEDPSTSIAGSDESIFPQLLKLYGNYPNPFNPLTTISFYLPTSEAVIFEVYNLLGQRIVSRNLNTLKSGENTLEWRGTDDVGREVASGLYIYSIKTKSAKASGKMLLLK